MAKGADVGRVKKNMMPSEERKFTLGKCNVIRGDLGTHNQCHGTLYFFAGGVVHSELLGCRNRVGDSIGSNH